MPSDKVSIIIPSYNHAKYLNQCIESALNQDYDNLEIILVDDGSTDGSLEIAKKYNDRITIILKPNGGTASALNVGIRAMASAAGGGAEWFRWLSADDVCQPNAISSMMYEIKKYIGHSLGKIPIFYSGYTVIDANGDKQRVCNNLMQGLDMQGIKTVLFDKFLFDMGSAIIHKNVFEECGMFNEAVGTHEDIDFLFRCLFSFNIDLEYCDTNTVLKRDHSENLASQLNNARMDNISIIRNNHLRQLNDMEKSSYLDKLKEHHKKEPLKVVLLRLAKNIIFRFLPRSAFIKICTIFQSVRKRC